MPQLLLELLSEEIPARMQGQAARDLERMAREKLAEQGLLPAALKTFAGPRRLTLVAEGLPPAQADRTEERKGPRVGAPDQAIDGFLRSTGLKREELTERDGVFFAVIARQGRPTSAIIAEIVPAIARAFPWPKSMTSGDGKLRWVRPLRRILCTFDGEVVAFDIDGIRAGDLTQGHRFMGSRQAFRARTFDAYAEGLANNFVVLDVAERKARIAEAARTLCFARNLELVEDEGLLDEVAGLTEWPVPILGDMDPAFLDLPPEVIRTSMRVHQRYFAVRNPATGALAPHFIVTANIQAKDGGRTIAEGAARVLTARLKDARYFWEEDRREGNFDRWLGRLWGVTFHAKLGTMYDRVERVEALAREIAPLVGADPEVAANAARLAKADLASAMVGEFPELQGIMGGYYAREAGLPAEVADAVRDHYKPQGPKDSIPTSPVTLAVALSDKLDTLVGFFAIDEKPTGSRDPYALRRASLGIIGIALRNGIRVPLGPVLRELLRNRLERPTHVGPAFRVSEHEVVRALQSPDIVPGQVDALAKELLAFFADRLKVQLREEGRRHDLVDAVFALGDDDLVRIVARVEALSAFLGTEDGANLLAGYKRAANILKAETKKHPDEAESYAGPVDPALLSAPEEKALAAALERVKPELASRLQAEQFEGAMTALAALRGPVDAFFDRVLVNADDAAVRKNRLRLLSQVQRDMAQVADFSQVGG
jgi:glycyl-tRNA synthetase beta chain